MLGIRLPRTIDVSLMTRGITALLVIWWHTGGYRVAHPDWSFLYVPGRLAVFVFFILSGYVIGYGFREGRYGFDRVSLLAFYRNRMFRIFPLFLAVSAAAAVLAWLTGLGTTVALTASFIARQILMLQWWHDYQLVGVFWTLGIEMQFYLLVPLLWALQAGGPRPLGRGVALYVVLAAAPAIVHFGFGASWDNRTLLGNLAHFQAGLLVNHLRAPLRRAAPRVTSPACAATLGAAVILILGATQLYHRQRVVFWAGAGTLLVDAAGVLILVLHCVIEERRIAASLFWRAIAAVGVLSYGIYAWHAVVMTFAPAVAGSFLAVTACSLLLALLTYYLVERPCLASKVHPKPRRSREPHLLPAT